MRRTVIVAIVCLVGVSPARASSDRFLDALGPQPPRAAALYDVGGERFLGMYRGRTKLPVASLMKMVTALVVSDNLPPDVHVRIGARAASARADRLQWRLGASFTVDELLHGLLLPSSNGAAYALASRVGRGSLARFRTRAAAKLRALGATDTVLVDPSGLDAPGQHATARDMALVAAAVLADPWLAGIVALDRYRLPWPGSGTATLDNLNHYLPRDDTAVGVKNGYTSAAGNTVAAAAERGGRVHIAVVLGGPDPYGQAERLIDLAFELAPGDPAAPKRSEPAPAATSTRLAAPPVEHLVVAATEPVRPASPTLLRFVVGAAFAGTVLRISNVRRRRGRSR